MRPASRPPGRSTAERLPRREAGGSAARSPVLVVVGGLPATGKTTVCREAARRTGAVHLRLDTIEVAVVDSGIASHPVGPVGYLVAYAVATDLLRQGHTVLAESVNPLEVTRAAWRGVAESAGLSALEVEVVCSDADEHRRRAETRVVDIPRLQPPTWDEITGRAYEPWSRDRVVLDTARLSLADAVASLVGAVERRSADGAAAARDGG